MGRDSSKDRLFICIACGKRRVRPLRLIRLEVAEFLLAMPRLARAEYPDPQGVAGRYDKEAAEIYWEGTEESLSLNFTKGLAAELGGECVYCAHFMGPARRQSFMDWERSPKGGGHG